MTFEEKLFDGTKPEDREDFKNACQKAFGNADGRHVLSCLMRAAHPMKHSPAMTEHEHGNCEVVATLWRFGSLDPIPPATK